MITINSVGQQISQRFITAMASDHAIVTYFEIWKPGGSQPLYTSVGDIAGMAILDGNVTLTKDQDARGQCSITLISPDGSMVPTTNQSAITPWGNEIRIYSGVGYPDGTAEYVPMGSYRINQVQITEQQGAIQMVVSGYDRSRNVSLNVTQQGWPDAITNAFFANQPNMTTPWPQMIQFVLKQFWSSIIFNDIWQNWVGQQSDPNDDVIVVGTVAQSSVFSQGNNMWSSMRQYAQAGGCDLYFGRTGLCTFKQDPIINFFSAASNPVASFSFNEGMDCTFDQFQRTLSDATAFNRVIVNGSGTILGETLTSFVYFGADGTTNTAGIFADDNDPTSPTYIGIVDTNPASLTYGQVIGPSSYGVVTNIITNNLLVTQNQVNNFATLTIRQNVGSRENVVINSMLTDPRMEVDDIVEFTRTVDGVVNTVYIVETVTIPLSMKSAMQLTVREKRNLR